MNQKLINAAIGFGMALILWLILLLCASFSPDGSGIQRFFVLLGGSLNGYIQVLTFGVFFYGMLDIQDKEKYIKKQDEGFTLNLLPIQEQLVLSPDEVAKIKLNVLNLEQRGINYLIASFIKKACTQYRNDQSISETLQVVDSQIDNSKQESEGQLEMVRYVIQTISALGFIGTVMGLSVAIGLGHLAKTEEGMKSITQNMYMAFDTTLVALLLGLVLTYRYHAYLEKLDVFYSRTKSYIIDNLISRIYLG